MQEQQNINIQTMRDVAFLHSVFHNHMSVFDEIEIVNEELRMYSILARTTGIDLHQLIGRFNIVGIYPITEHTVRLSLEGVEV